MKYDTEKSLTFVDGLALLFIGLKLAGIISWSWAWVLAPVWAPLAAVFVTFVWLLIKPKPKLRNARRRGGYLP